MQTSLSGGGGPCLRGFHGVDINQFLSENESYE